MTIQTSFNNIIKVSMSELVSYRSILSMSGYSLDEILDYDDGRSYEKWSKGGSNQLVLDISPAPNCTSSDIISEIIDCWVELRAIRNALETSDESDCLVIEAKVSAFDQLMHNIRDWEKDMRDDETMFKLMIKGEVDTAIISYYSLDEKTRQAVLQ